MLEIEIEGETNDKELMVQEALAIQNVLLTMHAIDDIRWAMENDETEVTIATITFLDYADTPPYEVIALKELWKIALEGFLSSLEEQEEYELCAEAKKLIDELTIKDAAKVTE